MIPLIRDIFMFPLEKLRLGIERRQLLSDCSGKVLEIGIDSGKSLCYYPVAVTKLTAVDSSLRLTFEKARSKLPPLVELQLQTVTDFEHLPFLANSFDQVVCFLVFCRISNQSNVFKEIMRVLRPGGTLKMIEHVLAPPLQHPKVSRFQQKITPLWKKINNNCQLDRDTVNVLQNEGFIIETQHTFWKDIFVVIKAITPGGGEEEQKYNEDDDEEEEQLTEEFEPKSSLLPNKYNNTVET